MGLYARSHRVWEERFSSFRSPIMSVAEPTIPRRSETSVTPLTLIGSLYLTQKNDRFRRFVSNDKGKGSIEVDFDFCR